MLGGVERDVDNRIVSAKALLSLFTMKQQLDPDNAEATDDVVNNWEYEILCVLGIGKPASTGAQECQLWTHIKFSGYFSRTFGDLLKESTSHDIPKLAVMPFLMLFYFCMFVRRATKYEAVIFTVTELLCVGCSILIGYVMAQLDAFFCFMNAALRTWTPTWRGCPKT